MEKRRFPSIFTYSGGCSMSYMKDLDLRIRQGGDDAIAAACELSDLAKERRGYEDIRQADGDITDIVTVLRGVGFAAVSPQAGDSASLLHYCVTHAADEIERLRDERRWIPVAERLPIGLREPAEDTPTTHATPTQGSVQERCTLTAEEREAVTNHDAVPDARARDTDRGRTDKSVTRPGDGTGNTPSDECGVCGDGTETAGERLVQRVLITQAMLNDNEMLRAEIARLRLSSAEREAIEVAAVAYTADKGERFAVILRSLLERLT